MRKVGTCFTLARLALGNRFENFPGCRVRIHVTNRGQQRGDGIAQGAPLSPVLIDPVLSTQMEFEFILKYGGAALGASNGPLPLKLAKTFLGG